MKRSSLTLLDQTQTIKQTAKLRGRFAKSFSFGLIDILLSPNRLYWTVFEALLSFSLFSFGIRLSPYLRGKPLNELFLIISGVYALSYIAAATGLGYNDRAQRFRIRTVIQFGAASNILALLICLIFSYLILYESLGRLTVLFGTVVALSGTTLVRLVLTFLMNRNPYRFTIIGSSDSMDEVIRYCSDEKKHAIPYSYRSPDTVCHQGRLPNVEELLKAHISDIVFTEESLKENETIELAFHCLAAKIRVLDEVEFYLQIFERLPIDQITKTWTLYEGIVKRQVIAVAIKRWFDVIITALALIVFAPFFLLIAIAIRIDSPGPAIFIQPRQGRYGTIFPMFKFRTMYADKSSAAASGGFTQHNDQRVTRLGRWLRPLHLDELPQFVNVLIGQMSLIGPRPEAIEFAKKMRQQISVYELRYLVRPGITGYAQINQGYASDNISDTKKKLSYDLYYLCRYSLMLDLQILLRTLFRLSHGAR